MLATDPGATLCFPLIEKHQINATALVPPAVSLWLQAIRVGRQCAAGVIKVIAGWRRAAFCDAGRPYSG